MARKKKNQEPIEYIDGVIEEGIKTLEDSILRREMMHQTAKDTSEITGVSKQNLIKMKDYLYYRGRGWGDDALDRYKPEEGETREKYPDRVSPAFRNVCEIIDTMYNCGQEDKLDVYLEAAKRRGVEIVVHPEHFERANDAEKIAIQSALDVMLPLQTCLCNNNDYMNDKLAPAAENQNVTPKSKFKKVVAMKHRIDAGKDLSDKIQDELVENIMYGDSLERLRDIGKPENTEEQN